jgi:phosphoribosylamine---glycine ligase
VVKDDALAVGNGVLVTDNLEACGTVVIEEFLDGPEVSLFAVTDGVTAVPLLPARDFKRAGDGDQGRTPAAWAPSPVPLGPSWGADQVRRKAAVGCSAAC